MLLNRPPFYPEVDKEVALEYARLQEDKHRGRLPQSREVEEMHTRVTDLENSVRGLGDKLTTSHKGLEAMLNKVLEGLGQLSFTAMEEVMKPSASPEVIDAAAAQSQGTRAWKTIETILLPALLNTPVEADVLRPVLMDVDGDVAEHVEVDVQIEKEDVDDDDAVDIVGEEAQDDRTKDFTESEAVEGEEGDIGVENSKSGTPPQKLGPEVGVDSVLPKQIILKIRSTYSYLGSVRFQLSLEGSTILFSMHCGCQE